MCRKTPTSVQAEERHFSGKTSKTKVHRNLGCVDCPDISRVSIPCGYLVIEGTDSKTCCVNFVSFWPKRLDCTFVEYRLHGFFLNSCYTFQLVEHLKQSRPHISGNKQ